MTNQPQESREDLSGKINDGLDKYFGESMEERFWEMMNNNQFIRSQDSITDKVIEYEPAINDMEAIVEINGQFDKYAIEEWLNQELALAVQQEREAIVKKIEEKVKEMNGKHSIFDDFAQEIINSINK